MDVRRLQIKVGILVVVSLLGVLGLLGLMGELRWLHGSRLTVYFSHTGNVVESAPVKLGGIRVGQVEQIELDVNHRDEFGQHLPVKMRLAISSEAFSALREDAAVTVSTQGPLGEAYLELYAGVGAQGPLQNADNLRGVDAPKLDLVANRLSLFLESASRVLDEDPQAINKLVGGLASLSSTLDVLVKENHANVTGLTSDLAQSARDLRELSTYMRKAFSAGGKGDQLLADGATSAKTMKEHLPKLTHNASVAMEGLAAITQGLSNEDGQRIKKAIERMDRIAERGDRLLARLETGEGTAGAVLKDPQVYDDLKNLIKDLRTHPWKILWKD